MTTNPEPATLSPERTALLEFLETFRHDAATLPDADFVNALRNASRVFHDTFLKVDGEGDRECTSCRLSTYSETLCTCCERSTFYRAGRTTGVSQQTQVVLRALNAAHAADLEDLESRVAELARDLDSLKAARSA